MKYLQCVVISLANRRNNEWDLDVLDEKPNTSNSTPTTEFKCDGVGRFAIPNSCEQYYYCWDTKYHAIFTCPRRRAFDPKTQRCVHNFAVCAAAPKCDVDRQLLPHPFDSSSYFQCSLVSPAKSDFYPDIQYRLYKKICARRGKFDAELGYCKLTAANEDEDDSSESGESANKMECKAAGVFIDYSNESRYFECITKNVSYARVHQTCPNNHVFSVADKRCIKLDGVKE